MKDKNMNNALKWVFLVMALIFWTSFICIVLFLIAYFNVWTLIADILCFILFIAFWRLARLKYLGYSLKYYFSNKKYNQEIIKSLAKFEGAPQTFIDKFKNTTKRRYRYAGYLFSRDCLDAIYKDKKAKETILDLYTKLYNCILSRGGFIEFFKQIENLNMDSWEIHNYMLNDLISNELDYLLDEIYCLTDYTVYDNGLSTEFTKRNKQMIEELNEIYSPLLFNFKQEIEQVLKKLNNNN